MSQRNENFFEQKKEWSKTKDEILGRYLKPYFQKLKARGKPICYVDCFAGKGMFDDGNFGSPLIALNCINETLQKAHNETTVYPYFIELYHYVDLNKNVENHLKILQNSNLSGNVVPGKFEDNIDDILLQHCNSTVFLYVDPYGIKAIDVEKFNSFKLSENKSVEMLINFNTWGFFREACRVLKADFKLDDDMQKYLVEYDPNNDLSRDELCTIAGGDYWIDIVNEYKNKCINVTPKEKKRYANEAELELSKGIADAFKRKYKYVLNVPIKSSSNNNVPKYRLFHLTNHTAGCILMADGMYSAISDATIRMHNGQTSLFNLDTEGNLSLEDDVEKTILKEVQINYERIDELICRIFTDYGLIANSSKLKDIIRKLEISGKIEILRVPSKTDTGKISTFMTEGKTKDGRLKRVLVRKE